MKFATLKNSTRDGELVLVSPDLKRMLRVSQLAPHLRDLLENWNQKTPALKKLWESFVSDSKAGDPFQAEKCESCLPRTWLFADGSAFIHHIKLVRKARNAELPATLLTVPLMYQAECGKFLAPTATIPQVDFSHGTDFEAEVGVIVDDVPMGVTATEALKHIKLVVLINDVSLRGLIPEELASGFGFFQSKPTKALSPVAVTPEELGSAWKDGRVHLPLNVELNGNFFGKANAGEMHFHFGELIAHAAKTRDLVAGTLIGSGTVANDNPAVGSSCLAEKRTIETIHNGKPETSFMKVGDRVAIWMNDSNQNSIFGRIEQVVAQAKN